MEDMKILEEIIELYRSSNELPYKFNGNIIQAIENLINKNKELEVITNGIKVLENNGVNDDTFYVIAKTDFLKGSYNQLLDDYIPKSKVKEKIEEYREKRNKLADGHFWDNPDNINQDRALFIAGETLKLLLEE